MRILSGIQPSGKIHIGNYFGAMKQQIALQDEHECFYFIANYHALTSSRDPVALRQATRDIVIDYLALGLDPNRATLYLQSDVPEVTELAWILNCATPVGLMQRAPAYKEKVENGLPANMGLFSYPILQAADILAVRADRVPVGKDQLPHIEIAQDVAQYLNGMVQHDILDRPEALLSETPRVVGTDGRKMSKTYGNQIDVFAPEATIKKQIMSIVTDSRPVGTPAEFGSDNASAILSLFLDDHSRQEWEEALEVKGVGYGVLKNEILRLHQECFHQAVETRRLLDVTQGLVEGVLREGAERARAIIRPLLRQVRTAVGLPEASA